MGAPRVSSTVGSSVGVEVGAGVGGSVGVGVGEWVSGGLTMNGTGVGAAVSGAGVTRSGALVGQLSCVLNVFPSGQQG